MLEVYTDQVKGYKDLRISFTLISNSNSKGLAILLPGAGYTVQRPLLHYSTGLFINKAFDVLQIHYHYNDKAYQNFSNEEIGDAIKFDVRTVIDQVLRKKSYLNFYLVGKSLGTIAISSELERDCFANAKVVWLTPLLNRNDVFDAMVHFHNKGLCFIGDKDPVYNKERFDELQRNKNIDSKLIPNVNHSLEYDQNVIESIAVLKDVMKEIEQF